MRPPTYKVMFRFTVIGEEPSVPKHRFIWRTLVREVRKAKKETKKKLDRAGCVGKFHATYVEAKVYRR